MKKPCQNPKADVILMKEPYQKPQMDVIPLSAENIILTSSAQLTGYQGAGEGSEEWIFENWGKLN